MKYDVDETVNYNNLIKYNPEHHPLTKFSYYECDGTSKTWQELFNDVENVTYYRHSKFSEIKWLCYIMSFFLISQTFIIEADIISYAGIIVSSITMSVIGIMYERLSRVSASLTWYRVMENTAIGLSRVSEKILVDGLEEDAKIFVEDFIKTRESSTQDYIKHLVKNYKDQNK